MQSNFILPAPATVLRSNGPRSRQIIGPTAFLIVECLVVYLTLIWADCAIHSDYCILSDATKSVAIPPLVSVLFLAFKWMSISRQVTWMSDPWISARGSLLAIAGMGLVCLILPSQIVAISTLQYIADPLVLTLTAISAIFFSQLAAFVLRAQDIRNAVIGLRRVALVGRSADCKEILTFLGPEGAGIEIVGSFDLDQADLPVEPVVHTNSRLARLIQERTIDEVIIVLGGRHDHRLVSTMARLAVYPVDVSLTSAEFTASAAAIAPFAGAPVMTVLRHRMRGWPSIKKRAVDAVLALTGLIITAPLLLLAIAAIKLTSKGPAIFKQRRTGLNLSTFAVWKLRTMRMDNGPAAQPYRQARYGDERVTALGRILRRYSIDELPQLVNVLRGEMSLVGPRPHPLALDESFRSRLHLFDARYCMLPGITGLAQVNGCRGETDTLEKMQRRLDFDLLYIRNWSMWLDLKILLLTVSGRFTHPNAY